jgi:hypothetical protein
MPKKAINWLEIKKRYLLGDKPKDIGSDYGLTAKQVSKKASTENWKAKKEQIGIKVEKFICNDIASQMSLTSELIGSFLLKIKEELPEIKATGGFTNPLIKIAFEKCATKYFESSSGSSDLQVVPGFNLSEDVDAGC